MTSGRVSGSVAGRGPVSATVSTSGAVVGTVSGSASGGVTLPWYGGPYDATPTVAGLTLATRRRSMREDVTVEPIPIGFVSNDAGGRTASIG